MVKVFRKGSEIYYQCEECRLFYKSEEFAKKCEEWCKKHRSCNLEIIKHAVNINL
ncbi:MAG: hypothetical protein QW367_02940 [Candidatus Aenigmatarchaeota archaeon]